MLGKRYDGQDCGLARALEIVGERWTLLIVRDAFFGVRRFSDFAEHLDVPRAVLADRLRSLVDAGVLARSTDAEHRGRAVYELTPLGRELWPVVHGLMRWGTRATGEQPRRRFTHAACGTELEPGGLCAHCDTTPAPSEVVTEIAPAVPPPTADDRVTHALVPPRRLLDPV